MVPKIAARGTSFKGAGAYYLHDKGAQTRERVLFTHTENLPVSDPDRALDCMAYTALHQNDIKAANDGPKTGRKLIAPVYTYSLSWAPDEQPSQEEMLQAGLSSLKALGLTEHEVLMVAHRDEEHPHLHLIVNRVHPQTGKAAVLSNDRLVLSRWAEAFEKEQGKIRCDQRVENNERRRKGQFVKDRRSLDVSRFRAWRRERLLRAHAKRQAESRNLSATHKGERQRLSDQRAAEIRQARAARRQDSKPLWAALFRRQREEKKALNQAQKTAIGRLRHFLKEQPASRGKPPRGEMKKRIGAAMRAVFGRDNPHGALARKHEAERKALARTLRRREQRIVREEIGEIEKRYKSAIRALERVQFDERRALSLEHGKQSEIGARDIRSGRDKKDYRKEMGQTVSDEFARRVSERLRKVKKKREQERLQNRDKGRERE